MGFLIATPSEDLVINKSIPTSYRHIDPYKLSSVTIDKTSENVLGQESFKH